MKCLAIITARGGSKRIPKKNIKDFCGKPIIAYSIEAALNSKIFDEVMVSTDSEEIANAARIYGDTVPFMRSAKNADDYATTYDVLLEVVNKYKEFGKVFDYICCIYPTAPFITAEKLKSAFNKFIESDADSLIPVVKFSFPPQRGFVINKENYLEYKWPENKNKRSQDLEALYHDVGQFYFYKTTVFEDTDNTRNSKIIPFELEETEVQDIDNITDWQLAELKFKFLNDNSKQIRCQQ